ncbi:hypothetical protein FPZ43_00165 [Mucilaginibacter pallidiroseus]|uniref:Uncharacterized protein n=1 Tax=Mucilaginibacter pallidiroseus TaxID=2599295 RepID=A0A563UHR3_9SPHI|nr:hypothetical protein [Mucilaginibacter pallidiroseus]TWR30932.1 hypothetical protein FPZ43_00165 [Mucilaginibacter pallidiroseus]
MTNDRCDFQLAQAISTCLEKQLEGQGRISCLQGKVFLTLRQSCVDSTLGSLLQQIYYSIDKHYPSRHEDVLLLIKDDTQQFDLEVKIWNTEEI